MAVTLPVSAVLALIVWWRYQGGHFGGGTLILAILFGISLGGTTWQVAGDAINAGIAEFAGALLESFGRLFAKGGGDTVKGAGKAGLVALHAIGPR
jgi:hypothetical protein